ncbi:MAG: LEA type 2 family protein [Gemmatimonadaceae bacterium]|nr:LEA type 2 family protein [Gemmatimonadaceae bacterium]
MNPRFLRRIFVVLGSALALAACSQIAKEVFTAPVVKFEGVRMGSLSLTGSTLFIQLGVRNPNRFALSATHTEYKLIVDDTIVVGEGQSNDSVTVGARDSTSIVLPLDVSWNEMTRAGGGALAAGEVNYRIVGKITANTPVGAHDIPLDAKGRFAPLKPRS